MKKIKEAFFILISIILYTVDCLAAFFFFCKAGDAVLNLFMHWSWHNFVTASWTTAVFLVVGILAVAPFTHDNTKESEDKNA